MGVLSTQAAAFIVTYVLSLALGPLIIPLLKRLKFGQTIRYDGPGTHLKKTGTPTIGGLIFVIPMTIVSAWHIKDYPELVPILLVTLGAAAIGFVDDLIKVLKKSKDGLNPMQKTFGILAVSAAFAYYAALNPLIGTDMVIPFTGMEGFVELPLWFYIPFITIVMYLIINSVNMTDGLDGLASSITIVVMLFFSIVGFIKGEWAYVKVFGLITAGGCLGFLTYNLYPAKVFMGDTGSLALGGAVGALAVVLRIPWVLLLAGGVYAAESLSVFIQVTSFKLRGKRVFKMAPIHHHFELLGWKEAKIVKVFLITAILLCVISFATLRMDLF
jgi:phospho-N-acetylmuramoyl-pentapeptide-transferase